MKTELQLTLNPDKEKIALFFPFFKEISDKSKVKITAWEKIDNSDFQFLYELFLSKGLKVKLDDIGYIFNYLRFIYRVSKSNFNTENEIMDNSLKELWPFFQMIEQQKRLRRISIQTETYDNIKITSEYTLKLFFKIFEHSVRSYSGMILAKNHLLEMEQNGYLDSLLKRRSGNKINYTETVLKQSVTMFKNYLKENTYSNSKKKVSMYTIIGKILVHIGFIEDFTYYMDEYLSPTDYYNKKARVRDIDITLKKTSRIKDELFPPHFLIELHDNLI